jgi:cell division protein FtsB
MQKTMTIKGFVLILALVLAAFFCLHLMMRGDLSRKAEEENALKLALTKLQEEEKDLKNQLSIVATEDYIISSARENFSYVRRDDILFEYSNPEALYAYTEEELRILVDEMAD